MSDADRAKAAELMSMIDNVGAFDHSNDEERDRYYVASNLAAALAAERAAAVADLRARVLALAFASDDGSEYEHDHGIGDGYPECPACWAEDIRAAVTDTTGGQQA